MKTAPFRQAAAQLNDGCRYWLPAYGVKDLATGFYAIAMRPDGTLEACSAPGLWHEIAADAAPRYRAMLQGEG